MTRAEAGNGWPARGGPVECFPQPKHADNSNSPKLVPQFTFALFRSRQGVLFLEDGSFALLFEAFGLNGIEFGVGLVIGREVSFSINRFDGAFSDAGSAI